MIEETFAPSSINTVEELMAWLTEEIQRRGGDPSTVKMLNTRQIIPNVQFSDEWPCWTLDFDVSGRTT